MDKNSNNSNRPNGQNPPFGSNPDISNSDFFNNTGDYQNSNDSNFGTNPSNNNQIYNSKLQDALHQNQATNFDQPKITEQYASHSQQPANQPVQQFANLNQNQQTQITSNQKNTGKGFFGFIRRFKWLVLIAALIVAYMVGSRIYSNAQLRAINPDNDKLIKVTVKSGQTVDQISKTLVDKKLVRAADVFSGYAQGQAEDGLQAGDFYLTQAQSVPQIFDQISDGPNPEVYQKQFIAERAPYAQELQEKYGVLASINLAQTILESNWGESKLASKYNNYYGIKAQGNQDSVTLQTKEYLDDEWQTVNADFAVYKSWKDGMLAHIKFLVNGTDLNPDQFVDFMETTNYKAAAAALVQDGYATDPDYADKLIETIEANNLQKYDR